MYLFAVLIRSGNAQAIDLLGHQFALPAHLGRGVSIERALHEPQRAAGIRCVHLAVDVFRHACFQSTGALFVGRDQTRHGSIHKRPFFSGEICRFIGFAGRRRAALSRRSGLCVSVRRGHEHRAAKAGAGHRYNRNQGQGFAQKLTPRVVLLRHEAPHQAVTDYSCSWAASRFGRRYGVENNLKKTRRQKLVTNSNRPFALMNRFVRNFAAPMAN